MLLNRANICHYLLDKGFIDVKLITDGYFTSHLIQSRNNSFIVNKKIEGQQSLFVKQVKNSNPDNLETLRNEATCYWLANNEPSFEALTNFLPKYYNYDYISNILVIEYLKNAISLNDYYESRNDFSLDMAEKIADLLSSFHNNIFDKIKNSKSINLFRKAIPFVFTLVGNRQKSWSNNNNQAELKMLELINQTPNFSTLVDEVRNSWKQTSLIHGDIKSANLLIEKNKKLSLIDWELADIGDPCWDLAAVFQIFFLHYIYAELKSGQSSNSHLEKVKPSLNHFWNRYSEKMKFTETQKKSDLTKSLQFSALKLIHTCFESTVTSNQLMPSSAKMLQLSLNILKNPQESLTSFFDIN